MDIELTDLLLHFAAVLVGGLISSIGLSVVARRPAGARLLSKTRWWGLLLFGVAAIGAVVVAFYLLLARVRAAADVTEVFGSPTQLFLVGLALGLPFSLPGVIATWSEMRPAKAAARKKKAETASREDRLQFAQDLERQIREYADGTNDVTASLKGDKGRVLVFHGGLGRQEGDRLVAALRGEMRDLGFERVEGEGGWWARV